MKYPLEKYRFYTYTENDVLHVAAVSTYAGRFVKGLAKCDPKDTPSIEKGKQIAAARCNIKVAEKRAKIANKKYTEAIKFYEQAQNYLDKMINYITDAKIAVDDAHAELKELLK